MISYDTYYLQHDAPVFDKIGASQPKARKEYKCAHCTTMIKVSEKHNKHFIKDEDGKVFSERFHLICPWELEQLNAEKDIEENAQS